MLIDLNGLKKVSRDQAPVLDSWFGVGAGNEAAQQAQEMFSQVTIMGSLRGLSAHMNKTPALRDIGSMPQAIAEPEATVQAVQAEEIPQPQPASVGVFAAVPPPVIQEEISPFQALRMATHPDSPSSQWLAQRGLFQKFNSPDCIMDLQMTADGGVSSIVRATDGYRRTVVCRPDGTSSQRITDATGMEIVRFNSLGEIVQPSELKQTRSLQTV